MGDGGELERALVDVTGTGKTVPSCREKRFEKKNWQKTLKLSDCRESIRKSNSAKLKKHLSSSFWVCLVSLKQQNLEIRAKVRIEFKMFGERVASLVKFYT